MIYFITGNENKFREAKAILPVIERLDLDLIEIQEIDPLKIIKAKMEEAFKHHSGEFIIEDGYLDVKSLGGLPGPFAKWFIKLLGKDGIWEIVKNSSDKSAEVSVIIGYAKNKDEISFLEGSIKGKMVAPRGENGFGWDSIFQPYGYDKTFAEMTTEEKNSISMRKIAFEKLKDYLQKNK
ncbi:TPA: non-canonical purine NTP pyrophosphatase [Candidatus Berkelbacteria bacterium]|uniref:Nucleoside triphosphatase (Putative) n=1 Tax=Berkelbacteria bacterium GW2011_GWE1_39_12 TaxID=1618337 RepID=A0A0G4B4R4_9BACT|nr:MAG: nucleoside triphosphatase (putative) [Berkelbacteria bacterium GW2011_GWE1_39_12]HBO60312.1 non-canonical purine NTP pyrophosphatase [Candidatus Berkelbacteria bacterium]